MKSVIGSEFTGNIWENGEFGVAVSKLNKKDDDKHTDQILKNDEDVDWILNIVKVHGIEAALHYNSLLVTEKPSELLDETGKLTTCPLGLSTLPNSHKRCDRGEKGITTYGKRLVRNACYRLEKEIPKEELTFLTVTLPDISVQESIEISRNWSEVVRQFQQSLRRLLQEGELTGEIVGVTEIQMSRFQRTGVFALHLHLVFRGRRPRSAWVVSPRQIRSIWSRALKKYLSRDLSSYNWDSCENLQHVKKSVESYLGKYLTKGCQAVAEIHASETNYVFPSSWYCCTLSLRERVHNRVMRVSSACASHLIDMASSKAYEQSFLYLRPVVLNTESMGGLTIGWYGRLSRVGYDSLQLLFMNDCLQRDNRIDKFLTVE